MVPAEEVSEVGFFDYVPQSKPTNTVPPATVPQVNTATNEMLIPARQVPLPTPRQALNDLATLREMSNPQPGVLGKVSQSLDIINKGLEITERIRQAQSQQATIDTADELRCLNEKIGKICFLAEASIDFHKNFLRSIGSFMSEIRMLASVSRQGMMLDPVEVGIQRSDEDGFFEQSFDNRTVDVYQPETRNVNVTCTKEGGG